MGFEDRDYNQYQPAGSALSRYSMVTILIAINVIIFLVDSFTPDIGVLAGGERVGVHWLGDVLAAKTDQWYFVWTWLTHGFVHAAIDSKMGLMHIGGNMLTLYFLGRSVEYRLGRNEFLKFYLIAIVVGFLGFFSVNLLRGNPLASLVGASGAVSAVVVLFIFYFPRQKIFLWGILEMPAWAIGVLMLGVNIYYALAPGSGVAWEAHAAGALFGFLYFKQKWNFEGLNVADSITNRVRGGGGLRLHNPDAAGPDDKLKQKADAILEKINQQGEGSLSSRERKTLQRYSAQIRKQRR
jgi:membrane associated rhomboid family serine protease